MSGSSNRQRLPAPNEDEHEDEDSHRRASLAQMQLASGLRASGGPPSIEDLRTQEFMAAAMLDHPSRASLPPLAATRAAAMASAAGAATWQEQLEAARSSSVYARMAQAQRAQLQGHQQQLQQPGAASRQSLLEHQYHMQQQQQAVAAEQAKAQQEEIEFNSLLLQKRQIDEMLLSSALNSRRYSMESGIPPSIYGGATGAAAAGAAGMSHLPMSMGGAAMLGTHNINNRPIMGDADLLSGKIPAGLESGRAAFWAEQNRRISDPQHDRLRMMAGAAMQSAPSSGAAHEEDGAYEEEDDETYFNDTGTDEVDRDFKRSQENFPLKLYRIIYEVVKSGRGDVISFFPHGRAFAVHKPKEFISEIMPKYFATGRMNTFLKQLNLYGFRRITEGRDKGGYFHAKFIHGKRHLCKLIKRKKTDSKPAAGKAKVIVVGEAKEADTGTSPVSTEAYAKSLNKQIKKQRQEESKSPPSSPSSSRHPKMRWKNSQEGR